MLEGALADAVSTYSPRRAAAPAGWDEGLAEALHFLLHDMGIGVAVSLLSEPDSETSKVLREHLVRPRVERLRELFAAETAAGRLSPDLDVDVVLDFVLGSAYSHVARYGSLGEDWPRRVHRALTGVLAAHRP